MVTTAFLACAAPPLVAPAMNDRMYADAATQANLTTLRDRGVVVIEPGEGALASRGEQGRGRLPEPEALLAEIEALLPSGERPWTGCECSSAPAERASRSTRSGSSATDPAAAWAWPWRAPPPGAVRR